MYRPGASVRSCHASSIRLGHLAGSRPGDVPPYLMRGRSIVVPHCEKSAAVASLEAQTNGLSDHLESVANKMKKSPGQFSATESQGRSLMQVELVVHFSRNSFNSCLSG